MISRVRRVAILIPLGGACVLALSCGSASRATATTTKPDALAFARAVNLTPRDLPGSEALPSEDSFAGVFGKRKEERPWEPFRCSVKSAHPVALAISRLASRSGLVASAVRVMPSMAAARSDLAMLNSPPGGASCFARAVGETVIVESGKTTVASHAVSAKIVSLTSLLGQGATAVHALDAVPGNPKLIPVAATLFRVGRAEILLFALSGEHSLSSATERHLLLLLYRRAKAHTL